MIGSQYLYPRIGDTQIAIRPMTGRIRSLDPRHRRIWTTREALNLSAHAASIIAGDKTDD